MKSIAKLKKNNVGKTIDKRVKEFKSLGKQSSSELFKELCFCILTANFSAERSMKIQEQLGSDFLALSRKQLAGELKRLGHRFPNTRANYIVNVRKYAPSLKSTISSFDDERNARGWLVENIKGLGYKEASHFLRNIGYENLAIIDFHIVDLLCRYNLIERPKTLTRGKYLEIENLLRSIAVDAGLTLAELDLYLWYLETGKVLK